MQACVKQEKSGKQVRRRDLRGARVCDVPCALFGGTQVAKPTTRVCWEIHGPLVLLQTLHTCPHTCKQGLRHARQEYTLMGGRKGPDSERQ
jgi:hypothetical protein